MEKDDSIIMAPITFYIGCCNDENFMANATCRLPALLNISCIAIRG